MKYLIFIVFLTEVLFILVAFSGCGLEVNGKKVQSYQTDWNVCRIECNAQATVILSVRCPGSIPKRYQVGWACPCKSQACYKP